MEHEAVSSLILVFLLPGFVNDLTSAWNIYDVFIATL